MARRIKRKTRKRTTRKRRFRGMNVQQNIGFPSNKVVKMRYCDSNTLTLTTGVMHKVFYNFNSIFDPNNSGGGHQPTGFDLWAQFYNHYVVLGAKAKVQFVNRSSTSSNVVGCTLMDDTTTPSLWTTLAESGKGKYALLPFNSDAMKTFYVNYSAKKFFNLKDVKDNLTRVGAGMGANPSDLAILQLWAQPTNLADTASVDVIVTIDFIVACSEPVDLPQS